MNTGIGEAKGEKMADIRDVESLAKYLFRIADDDRVKDPYKRAKIHAYRDAFERLLASPTISTELKHGRWVDVEPAPWGQVYETCSECGIRQALDKGKDNFCGVCGAKMDERREDV